MNSVRVRLSKSFVGQEEADAVARVVLDSGFFGLGKEVKAFEDELAAYIGNGREVACTSAATSALHLALQACGIGEGDEVLAPTITYVATYQAISATGARPVSCEVRESDCWLDLEDAEARITPRTKAIVVVHYASGCGDLDALYDLARRYNLRVIEDAAHAFGCTYKGNRIGSIGDVVCFSFQGTKNITSGEGGAVVTADPAVAQRIRDLRLLDVLNDSDNRYAGKRSWEFDVNEQGWRYHMSDLMAAIGRVQLRRFEHEMMPRRVELGTRYQELLAGAEHVRMLNICFGEVVPHIFPIYVTNGRRDEIRSALAERGIETGIHYKPNHLLTMYGNAEEHFPVAERLFDEMLTLPLHPGLTEAHQDEVVEVVRSFAAFPSQSARSVAALTLDLEAPAAPPVSKPRTPRKRGAARKVVTA
ncbi:MAG: DegT/DnrJ/EryC1/StrS family aminotransferase [Dehalococcoidia bacterium]